MMQVSYLIVTQTLARVFVAYVKLIFCIVSLSYEKRLNYLGLQKLEAKSLYLDIVLQQTNSTSYIRLLTE